MTKHTPAPWFYEMLKEEIVIDSASQGICHIRPLDGNCMPNAHLIAAAPELLEACEYALGEVYTVAQNGDETFRSIRVLRKAIAKARGK